MRTLHFLRIGLSLSALASATLNAQTTIQQPDETLPGFKSQQVYDVNGADNVNLFSGDVHVTVPLGPEYPLSSGLTWRLAAHYSSKLWHMFQYDSGVQDTNCPVQNVFVTRAHVGGYSTIGAGWTLELGSVRPGAPGVLTSYKSPDGAHHFDSSNLDSDSDLRLDPRADGTYIVRKSDGTVLKFTHRYEIPTPVNGFDFSDEDRPPLPRQALRYGLGSIIDRFGNIVLQVTYVANCSSTPCPADAWKVQSVQLSNPARTITFHWAPPSGSFDVVNSIDFPVVSGGTLTANFTVSNRVISRSPFDAGHPPSPGLDLRLGPSPTTLPFLASVTQASQTFAFDYDAGNGGVLQTLTLPTGGRVVYAYGTVAPPSPCQTCVPEVRAGQACVLGGSPTGPSAPAGAFDICSKAAFLQRFFDASPSVTSRTEKNLLGGASDSTTTYERDQFGSPEFGGNPINPDRVVRRVIVKRPDGNGNTIATKHVFAAAPASGGFELSRRYYADCDTGGTPVRSVVQCFRGGAFSVCGVMETPTQIADWMNVESLRPDREETWYGANPIPDKNSDLSEGCKNSAATSVPCWQDDFNAYDPLHPYNATAMEYSMVTRSSNSGILIYPQNATRTTITNWAPVSVPGGTWLPKLYTYKSVADSPCVNTPCTVTTNYSFDTLTGFLNSTTVNDSTYGWMMHSYLTHDPSTWDSSTESFTASFDATTFTNTRTFQSGLVLSSKRTAPTGISWKGFDVDRNTSTGLITTSRDPNGLASAYGYDSLSRLTSVSPPAGEFATTYCYFDWSTSGEASAALAKKSGAACSWDDGAPGSGSGSFEAYQYDGMGRLKREMRRLPNPLASGSYFSFRESRYNSAGLKSFESEWTPCGVSPSASSVRSCFPMFASAGTTYSNFDFLGRPRMIQLADGKAVTKSFNDVANVQNSDFTEVTSMDVGGVTVNSASRKDILGRLLIAAEPAPAPALFGWYSSYAYNVLDKMVSATVAVSSGDPNDLPPIKPAVTPQPRTFTFDSFGLLRSENHPEKGRTNFTSYNALGKVKTKTEGGNSYAYTYDALSRLTALSANGLQYLTNVYDTDFFSGAGGSVLGRLTETNSYHPLSDQNIRVAHNYAYGGLGGRLSIDDSYTFLPGNNTLFHAPASYAWNSLGLLNTHSHARPSGGWNETTTYVSGLPYSIAADGKSFVANASYNPSGGLLTYQTGNGVVTHIDADASLMPRPAQIRTTGADVNFGTGTYTYDGSGNVKTMGGDVNTYDARSRLAKATYASTGGKFDTFTLDTFGNITRRDFEGGQFQDLATTTATNHLGSASYDALGNLTGNGTDQHFYDALSRQTRYLGSGSAERYYYDGAGERMARVVFASSLPQQSTQERFYTLTPCRILDTRNPAGTYGRPAIAGQASRSFPAAGVCGIPSGAKSLALNVTTINAAAASGNVRLYPTGLSYQPLGTANVYKAGYARANQTFGSIDGPTAGSFTLFNDAPAGYPVDVIVDVSGYFAPGPNTPPQTGDSWFLTTRNLDKRPSTEFRYDTATAQTTVLKDYVYFGNQLIGTYTTTGTSSGTVFYTNDHIGSPRFLTAGASPTRLVEYRFRAFGQPLSTSIPGQGPEFATMERDLASSDLYDHARYQSGKLWRFNSPDQLGGHPEDPQSWNRYTYARNNPLKYVDQDGRSIALAAALPALGSLPLTPPQMVVLTASTSIATGLWIGQQTVGGISINEGLTRFFTGLLTLDMKSATKPGAANGPTAGKRMPKSVQQQVADEAKDGSGQTHCQYCGVETGTGPGQVKPNTDHIVPASRGGDATAENAQHTCETCNKSAQANPEPKTTGQEKVETIRDVPQE